MTKTTNETFSINGEQLLKKIKELVNQGNVRKITITDKSGKELMSFPLTVGVVGAVFALANLGVRFTGLVSTRAKIRDAFHRLVDNLFCYGRGDCVLPDLSAGGEVSARTGFGFSAAAESG